MKKKISIVFPIIFVILSCSVMKSQSIDSGKEMLTTEITQIEKKKFFNGFAVSVVNEKGTLYEKGFGLADVSEHKKYTENTIQNIASVSKTFVGMALLKAQELGKLKLDDPVEKYLPFAIVNPHFPDEKITIRHLANHTSSIADNEYYLSKNYILRPNQKLEGIKMNFDEQVFNPRESMVSMESLLKEMLTKGGKWYTKESFLNQKPGAIYEYSNVGTALTALVIEKATGKPFNKFAKEYILKPLKMSASGWKADEVDFTNYSRLYEKPDVLLPYYEIITYPDGGLITSVHDLSKFLTELIRGYNGKGALLSAESYKEYFRPQLSASNYTERKENNPYDETYNIGIFIGFGHTGYIGHTGGDPGVMSIMFFDPKTNIGRIMVFNTDFSDKKGNDAFYGIWNILEKYQSKLK
ncbi:beta-lactamase family protein [Elizabethkingia meningoseptica]|nr:beta-lactamase family protein [Elizabethkingia meningoseptica]